jgi:hypothetical protein
MKTLRKVSLAAVFTVAASLAAGAFAQGSGDTPFDKRMAAQHQRIENGTQSGALTDREAHRLQAREQHLQRMNDRIHADGTVTPGERHRMGAATRHQSHAIARQKHDRQHDFNHDGRTDRPHPRQPRG